MYASESARFEFGIFIIMSVSNNRFKLGPKSSSRESRRTIFADPGVHINANLEQVISNATPGYKWQL